MITEIEAKKHILVQGFSDIDEADSLILEQIEYHEKELFRLRREAKLFYHIYLPANEKVARFFKKGRKLEWNEYESHVKFRLSLICDSMVDVQSINQELPHIRQLHKEPFVHITTLFEQSSPVVRVTGYLDKRLM